MPDHVQLIKGKDGSTAEYIQLYKSGEKCGAFAKLMTVVDIVAVVGGDDLAGEVLQAIFSASPEPLAYGTPPKTANPPKQ